MQAITGTAAIFIAYFLAGWLGYQLGVERGIRIKETKRRRFY